MGLLSWNTDNYVDGRRGYLKTQHVLELGKEKKTRDSLPSVFPTSRSELFPLNIGCVGPTVTIARVKCQHGDSGTE